MARLDTHWSRAGEAGTFLGMKLMLLAYRIFGRIGFRFFLYPVMVYYYLVRKEARLASKQYLERIQPFLQKDQKRSLSSFQHFITFGELLLDKFLAWMGKIRREDVVFETKTLLNNINNGGYERGGIIIVSHLGNTEICNALAYQLPNIRLSLLVYTQHAEKYNSLVKKDNKNARIDILQVTEVSPVTAMLLSDRINNGEYIIISGDRTPVSGKGRVSEVTFLGHTAPMPQGAFLIASLLECPVYLLFCLKQKKQYHIYVELFSERLKFLRKKRHIEISKVVQDYAKRLEYFCIKAPLQWLNFFPFWNDNLEENFEGRK